MVCLDLLVFLKNEIEYNRRNNNKYINNYYENEKRMTIVWLEKN